MERSRRGEERTPETVRVFWHSANQHVWNMLTHDLARVAGVDAAGRQQQQQQQQQRCSEDYYCFYLLDDFC
eukprot:5810873-Alexandrium_andersonii.AAC.1